MAKDKRRIVAQVRGGTRELILRMFRPTHPNVYCQCITLAYKVNEDFQYSQKEAEVRIIGRHVTSRHEALICTVAGQTHRPDGKLYHITLSTADGVPPAEAGDINPAKITPTNPVVVELRFESQPLWVTAPTRQHEQLAA